MDDGMYIIGFVMFCQLANDDYRTNMKKASKQDRKAWWFTLISVLLMLFWIWMAVIYFNHVKHK